MVEQASVWATCWCHKPVDRVCVLYLLSLWKGGGRRSTLVIRRLSSVCKMSIPVNISSSWSRQVWSNTKLQLSTADHFTTNPSPSLSHLLSLFQSSPTKRRTCCVSTSCGWLSVTLSFTQSAHYTNRSLSWVQKLKRHNIIQWQKLTVLFCLWLTQNGTDMSCRCIQWKDGHRAADGTCTYVFCFKGAISRN